MSDTRFDYRNPPPDLLRAARAEGFAGGGATNTSSPEAALLSLYSTWVESEVAFELEWSEYLAAQLPQGEDWASVGASERRRIMELPDYPFQELDQLRELAEQVAMKWPEHPISDHAKFALLRAGMPRGGYPDGGDVAALLGAIESPQIREQAAMYVTRQFESTSSDVLDLVDAFELVPTSSATSDLALTTWALNRSVQLEDWDRALAWSERLRSTIEKECTTAEPDWKLHCETRQYELRDVAARLGALGLMTPRTWQEALTAAAWRCHLTVAAHQGTSRTVATWNADRWTFAPWDAPTDTTRCLDQILRTEIAPAEPTQVRITLEGPPRQP